MSKTQRYAMVIWVDSLIEDKTDADIRMAELATEICKFVEDSIYGEINEGIDVTNLSEIENMFELEEMSDE